ncbi:MAG: sulfite exporter TauE/SafE family protein [Sulfurisoma sp.]|nr:sulfite exporter TauE/SafE family protein [Sulfurisoma sp.]
MIETTALALAALIFAAALLYSSVGHAGASGYLMAMALFGLAPAVMRPTALTLNILVAIIATWKFWRAGRFSWPLFWPLALTSIPGAYIGGLVQLPGAWYRPLLGAVLLYAAWHFLRQPESDARPLKPMPRAAALASGAGIGLLSGLTGVGGGIFLSPLLLMAGWGHMREVSGVAAAFILVNSVSGLLGVIANAPALHQVLPEALPLWALAAVAGGWIGAEYGSRRLKSEILQRLLAAVLAIAGVKMLVT